MTYLNQPNAMLKNLLVISEQFEDSQFVSITFYNKSFNEIVSLLHVHSPKSGEHDKTISDIATLIDSVYKDSTDIEGIALIVYNKDGDEASATANTITFHPAFEKYPLVAVLYTDGFRWHDIITREGGEIDHSEITDFQLRAMVENDNLSIYTGLSNEAPD